MKKLNKVSYSIIAMSFITVIGSSVAFAATDTSNLTVSSSVTANCSITTSAINFGDYDPVVANAASNLDGTGSVSVTCTDGASATITLGQGANPDTGSSDSAPLRRMNDGSTGYISYSLFQESGRATAWTNDPTGQVSTTGTGTVDAHTIYGRISANQNVPAGSYTDTVVATVTF